MEGKEGGVREKVEGGGQALAPAIGLHFPEPPGAERRFRFPGKSSGYLRHERVVSGGSPKHPIEQAACSGARRRRRDPELPSEVSVLRTSGGRVCGIRWRCLPCVRHKLVLLEPVATLVLWLACCV